MKGWLFFGGLVSAAVLVWWIQRWQRQQDEYWPESWTHRQAEKAWKK